MSLTSYKLGFILGSIIPWGNRYLAGQLETICDRDITSYNSTSYKGNHFRLVTTPSEVNIFQPGDQFILTVDDQVFTGELYDRSTTNGGSPILHWGNYWLVCFNSSTGDDEGGDFALEEWEGWLDFYWRKTLTINHVTLQRVVK